MTNDEYNDLSAIICKLESLQSTFETVRFYSDPYNNDLDGVFHVACYSMKAVLSELNARLDAVYKSHDKGVRT